MNLSPEWKLLLACAKANLTAEDLRLKARLVLPELRLGLCHNGILRPRYSAADLP